MIEDTAFTSECLQPSEQLSLRVLSTRDQKLVIELTLVVQAFNPSIQEVDAGESLSLWLTWSPDRVPG